MVLTLQLFLNAKYIGYEYSILYNYYYNQNSITKSHEKNLIKVIEKDGNVQFLKEILIERGDYDLYKIEIENCLQRHNVNENMIIRYMKWAIKALLPYGILKLFRYLRDRKNGAQFVVCGKARLADGAKHGI
ncbi:MAG: hypothetical protein LBH43_10725 [Treponema sp.]|jgi:hypothetical protein|nr:hypothetical protein [Treponema sp.]